MAYTHTDIDLTTSLDVISKYKQLTEVASDGDSLYIRAREVVMGLKENSLLTNGDEGKIISGIIAELSKTAMVTSFANALDWAKAEKTLAIQKMELEYKIDQMKLEAEKAEYDRDLAKANKIYMQAKTIREMGNGIVYVDGNVASLPDNGKMYLENVGLEKDNTIKTSQDLGLQAQTKQTLAQIHKLVADTYVNHGMYTGYTISNTGITGTSKVVDSFVTLSEMNKRVAAEQAKGYALNAYGNAASSSAGMIGTLIAAEIPNLDLTNYLTTWKTSVDNLNKATVPVFTQSSLSL